MLGLVVALCAVLAALRMINPIGTIMSGAATLVVLLRAESVGFVYLPKPKG